MSRASFFLYLACLLAIAPARDVLPLPEIKFADLFTADEATAEKIVSHLTSLGALQITGIPGFAKARIRALEDLPACAEEEKTVLSAVMRDGSLRRTVAAASVRGVPGEMNNVCGEAAKRLRGAVDSTMSFFFQSLDVSMNKARKENELEQASVVMAPSLVSFRDLIKEGEHLEHLHAYYAPSPSHSSSSLEKSFGEKLPTLDYHVDSGLLIAMTKGLVSPANAPSDDSGLYLRLPDGKEVKAEAQEDALLVLMGQGAVDWLSPVFKAPFRAVPHKMVADLSSFPNSSGTPTRSWYGKMYLPPSTAILASEGITFAEHNQRLINSAPSISSLSLSEYELRSFFHIRNAANSAQSHRMMTANDDLCGAGEIYCWARCMSTADLSCGDNAVCWNSDTQSISPGGTHCAPGSACNPTCLDNPNAARNTTGYCFGSGTSMFMQGFVSIVQEPEGKTECVNLWFVDWTLDSKGKYAAACIGVFMFCLALQYLHSLRSKLTKVRDIYVRAMLSTLLYTVNVTFGYFVMLVAMTYSVELFCMVCAGMTVGYGMFLAEHAPSNADRSVDPTMDGDSVHQPLVQQSHEEYEPPKPTEKVHHNFTKSSRPLTNTSEDHKCCGDSSMI